MTRSSITKKALFISTCALLFSMLMMAGSTFAWFTDSVSTGSNKITTGSLKVELLHTNAKVTKEEAVTQSTLLFTDKNGEAISWEPGAVAYENFTVKNAGDLALNYRLALDLNNANTIKGTNGKSLKDVLKVKVVKGGVTDDNVTKEALAGTDMTKFIAVKDITNGQLSIPGAAGDTAEPQKLTPKKTTNSSSAVYGVILYWQPNSETDYQYNLANYTDKDSTGKSVDKTSDGKDKLSIDLGISLGATQAMEESDSSGNDYDREATYPAGNASELQTALKDGATIELTGNIALDKDLIVDKNVTIKSVGGAVISGGAIKIGSGSNVTLKNITFRSPRTSDNKGVSLKADNYSGDLVVDGCRFEEPQWSSIEITVNAAAKASISITDCTFAVPEASGSAGHKYDSEKCKIQNADARVAASDQKLAAGAHRVLCINGAETTKLVLTGNTFTGLKNCDAAAAVEISGIADAKIADNEVDANDDTAKIKVGQNISPKGFSKK